MVFKELKLPVDLSIGEIILDEKFSLFEVAKSLERPVRWITPTIKEAIKLQIGWWQV